MIFRILKLAAAALVAAVILFRGPASARLSREIVQQHSRNADQLFNWYDAAIYGAGVYSIGEQTVGVLRAPLGYRLREAGEEQGPGASPVT